MSSEKFSAERRCRNCGAKIKAGAKECWLCAEEASIRAGTPEDEAWERDLAQRITLPEPRNEFGVMSVFGILSILIGVGLVIAAPGILVILFIVATPVLIRTMIVSRKETPAGPMTGPGMVGFFFSTLGVIVMVGLASFAAFYATCFVVCLGFLGTGGVGRGGRWNEGTILIASIGAGLVPGLFVAYWLFRRLWPRRG